MNRFKEFLKFPIHIKKEMFLYFCCFVFSITVAGFSEMLNCCFGRHVDMVTPPESTSLSFTFDVNRLWVPGGRDKVILGVTKELQTHCLPPGCLSL